MNINELCKDAYERSKASGWHENSPKPGDPEYVRYETTRHMLVVTEIAEATEALRNKWPEVCVDRDDGGGMLGVEPSMLLLQDAVRVPHNKPEGEAVELADALIRICDIAGSRGWDMEAIIQAKLNYNATRGHRHGGKAV